MSKSHYALLGFGLAACLLLSLMMQHLLEVRQERDVHPVAQLATKTLGARLREPCTIEVVEKDEGQVVVELGIYPIEGTPVTPLARDAGRIAWRKIGTERVVDVVRITVHPVSGEPQIIDIDAPPMARRKFRKVDRSKVQTVPTPPKGSATPGRPTGPGQKPTATPTPR